MNEPNVTQAIQESEAAFATIKKHWIWYLLLGMILVVLGVIGAVYALTVSLMAMIWIGALLIAAGIFQIVYAFFTHYWRGFIVNCSLGILAFAVGIFMIGYPLKASLLFTLIIAAFLFISGILRIIFALQARSEPAWWIIFILGLISIVLALMIWAHWPASGLWVIGLFISIEIFLTGWSMTIMSIAAKCHK